MYPLDASVYVNCIEPRIKQGKFVLKKLSSPKEISPQTHLVFSAELAVDQERRQFKIIK